MIAEAKQYFESLGYEVIKIEQIWRHITGILKKGESQYFLKLATSEEIGKKTENECRWNSYINSFSDDKKLSMAVPKVVDSGKWNNLFWFLAEYVEGKLIASPNENQTKLLEENLGLFARTAKEIILIDPEISLLGDDGVDSPEEKKRKMIEKIENWAKESGKDIAELVKETITGIENVIFAPVHGDFVPWHGIKSNNGNIYLVDGESAKMKGIKFYDVAYFYHRVYTKMKRSDLADRFLDEFRKIYSFSEEDKKCFKFILGQRIIGGYFDAKNDGITSMEKQDELKNRLLENRI